MKRTTPERSEPSSEDILAIAKELQKLRGTHKERLEQGRKLYPDFAEDFPVLFDLACDSKFDMDRLQRMLWMREQVKSEAVTLDQASAQVGQELFDTFIKDKIGKNDKT